MFALFNARRALLLAACVAVTGSQGIAAAEAEQAGGACTYAGYVAQGSPAKLFGVDGSTGVRTLIGPTGQTYNAMGHNRLDDKIYALDNHAGVVLIDPATGAVSGTALVRPGTAGALPKAVYYQGDVSQDGKKWYVRGDAAFHVINTDPGSPDYLSHEQSFNAPLTGMFDLSVHPVDGKIYAAAGRAIRRLDPVTRIVATVGTIAQNDTWGGQFFDAAGNLYLSGNSGPVVKVDLTQMEGGLAKLGTATSLTKGASTANNDGAPCRGEAPEPPVVEPPVVAPDPYQPQVVAPDPVQPPVVEPDPVQPPVVVPDPVQPPVVVPDPVQPPVVVPEPVETPYRLGE